MHTALSFDLVGEDVLITGAELADICALADRYDALVMVDDSHAVGFMGRTGRGTHEHCGNAALSQKSPRVCSKKRRVRDGLFYPVVPQGQAHIHTQISAAHTREDLAFALNAFAEVK